MKRWLSISTLVVFFGLLPGLGCKEKFFDEYPQDQLTEGVFYQRASDFEQALNAAYSSLRGQYRWFYAFGDVASDDTYNWKRNNNFNLISFNESNVTSDNTILSDTWNSAYQTIARCNAVIVRSDSVVYDDALKTRYLGEARFLRALCYFNLVRVYGDVPLIEKEIIDPKESFDYGREPIDQVYELILRDLTVAEANLPDVYTRNADIGRATRLAAKGLLGNVLLTRKRYAEAAVKLKEVIASGRPRLLSAYTSVFNPDSANNREVIFAVQYARALDPAQGSPFGNDVAPNEPVGRAVVTAGSGQGYFHITTDLANAIAASDKRKAAIDSATGTRKYYYTRKYFDPRMSRNSDAGNDWIVLRYADVLLMAAEAINESGTVAEALPYVNQVRQRAGIASLLASDLDQASLRLGIEKERRIELNCEGHRWFDLVRTGRVQAVMKAFFTKYQSDDDQAGKNASIQDYELLFPVPKFQVDLNPDKIKQNVGY